MRRVEFRKPTPSDPIEDFLETTAEELEPQTHCCECTPGEYYELHLVHIQYFNCNCKKKDYIFKRN